MALRQAREAIITDLVSMLTAPESMPTPLPEAPVADNEASGSVCPRQ
jgi:hypothetical protein